MSKIFGIDFQNVSFRYFEEDQNNVIDDFSLSLQKGKVSVITGPSGCGKSTLLYLASGLYPENGGILSSGTITMDGEDVPKMSSSRRSEKVRMVFQNADLQFCFPTVKQEMIFSMELANIPPENMPELLDAMLEKTHLEGFLNRNIATLSGGEKQRLSLACQLVSDVEWLFFDEIFTQVDTEQARELIGILKELKEERDLSYVIVDHHLEHWMDIADDIFVLDIYGKLRYSSEKTKFFSSEDWNEVGVITKYATYPQTEEPRVEKPFDSSEVILQITDMELEVEGKLLSKHIDLTLEKGKRYALMGPSGVGKTTLLKTIAGFLPNTDYKKRTHEPIAIRYVFQNPQDQFIKDSIIEEFTFSFTHDQREIFSEEEEKIRRILVGNGLWDKRHQPPFTLSEGQQRRVAVLSILCENADLFLFDEPCYAQDYKNTIAMMSLLSEAVDEHNSTILFTCHDWNIANHYADHVLSLTKEGIVWIT